MQFKMAILFLNLKRMDLLLKNLGPNGLMLKIKKAKFDCIAKNIITIALNSDEFFRISQCSSAKEMWDTLEVTCTDQVIGCDDVAPSDNIGVLNGTPSRQKGSKSGSQYSRRSQKWRSPISNVCNRRSPELRHSRRM